MIALLSLCVLLTAAPASSAPVTLKAGLAPPGDEVSLVLTGIAVPSRSEAGLYLFGRLSAASASLRALLLRSTDGGAHWREVLPEVEHSEVLSVHFMGCQGRALVGWITEGPGELSLFASTDCGATWKRRSTLPKAVWSEWWEQVAWSDARRGTVWLSDTAEENTPPRALATQDGGRTWRPLPEPPPPPAPEPALVAQGPSGVRWTLVQDARTSRLERREGEAVEVRASIPTSWRRRGNALVPSP